MAFNLSRFDLVTLRLFVAAVEHGSLTAGAERLGISLAAASKRIAELEAHVGTPLLARSKRGVVPSPAGLTLLPHAAEMVARLAQLALAMSELQGGTGGQLRLWANTSAFGGFLPALLAAYVRQYPQVRLDLEDAISEDAVRGVLRGAVELGIVGDNVATEGLQALPCDTDELVVLLPPGHPLAPRRRDTPVPLAELLAHDFVAFARTTTLTRQLVSAAEALHLPLKLRAQVRSFDAMGRMVAAGLGLAMLPRRAAEPYAHALGLVIARVGGMRGERRLLLVMRDESLLSPPARAFVEMARARVA